jgi:hypothetical protein
MNRAILQMDAEGLAMNGLVGQHGAIGINRGQIQTLDDASRIRLGLSD